MNETAASRPAGRGPAADAPARLIVRHTLVALNKETGGNGVGAVAADVRAFIADPHGASFALFARVGSLRIERWYDGAARPSPAERHALWITVRREMGKRAPGFDPGGWSGLSTVLALAKIADAVEAVETLVSGSIGPPPAYSEAPISAGAEAPRREGAPIKARAEAPRREEAPAAAGAEPPPDEEPRFGGPPVHEPPAPGPRAAPPLVDVPRSPKELRGDVFSSEAPARTGIDPHPAAAPQPQTPDTMVPRWIQARAWRGDAPAAPASSLAPAKWNLLGVHIGPTDLPRTDAPFPAAQVDFSGGDVTLTVQLELAGARVAALAANDLAPFCAPSAPGAPSAPSAPGAPGAAGLRPEDLRKDPALPGRLLSGPLALMTIEPEGAADAAAVVELAATSIVLPRAGTSTIAFFAVCPLSGVTQLEGRIAVIHKNRVLQTARVAAGTGADAAAGEGLVVRAESSIHPRDDDLAKRRDYDVAIQVSDVGGKLHLAIQGGGSSIPVQLDDLTDAIQAIRDSLESLARNWDYTKPALEQPIFQSMLYGLAGNGAAIEQHLRKMCGDQIDGWQRIHLVPVTNEFFPLEYVYAGPVPKFGAKPCPNLFGALERGSCSTAVRSATGADTACPHQQDNGLACPMHFWGFSRLIERNGTVRPAPARSPAATRRVAPAVPSRQSYGKVRAVLFGASDRTFAYAEPAAQAGERAALAKSIGALSGAFAEAGDWERWRQEAKKQPNLLVLLVHTDKKSGTRVLEIGAEKFLGYQEILPDLTGAAGQPQLLLLLGCSTADVTENFQPYPERFRDAGASIVLAPIAPIRGAEAVPIAKHIAERLAQWMASPTPIAFGELLPQLRRELLLKGHPGVLSLVGFGDGDWQLGGP